ncbi:HNH endonuclease signature motif containing protein [Actinomarinicola tropica]|uniref:HNH nuclease domain-containing protein n=1 Tax=Actinomarinicola tropica TaxID=2789776 RepID=A0A5Q2RJI8_9ACTN|nr:HNH endonuclease signature motif containing protein [Actinomarinicola tropica]QGG94556.1 hypothetical protein GH723_05225 [Actinomarinicola tropica]
MFDAAALEANLAELVGSLDPTGLDPADATVLLDGLARIERLAATGVALVSTQVDSTGMWRGTGARDPLGYVAQRTGGSRARARDGLAVGQALASMPRLDAAMRAGALTIGQAADIATAVIVHPDREAELVALASHASPRKLTARCVEICAEGQGADEQHRRASAERTCVSQVGRDGVWRLSSSLPVIDGAELDAILDRFQDQIFRAARAEGRTEPFDAYRADALLAMARASVGADTGLSSPVPSGIRHTIVVTVPHTALLGDTDDGVGTEESGTIPGVGPVPVSTVARLLTEGDPVVKAVVTRGREITACATLTRSMKDDLRLAVLLRHSFECAVPDCDSQRFVELDHERPFAQGGPTSYENLRPLCFFHHDQRTHHGYELHGRPGTYRWLAPDGSVLAADRPPVAA